MTEEQNKYPDKEVESKKVIQNVDGGDPGISRDSVEKARQSSPEQAAGLPKRPPEIDPDNPNVPLRPDHETRTTSWQAAGGGAKEEFETAADDAGGWKAIRSGFAAEGRENGPDAELAEEKDSELPADGGMNAEARGVNPGKEDAA